MKTKFLTLTLSVACALLSHAQFQISVSGGTAISSAGMKLGEEITISETSNSYGSYGEGSNIQIRGTYFFNDTFGADLSLGYLHGADQTVSSVSLPDTEVDAIARARAFGASLAVVYKFTNNIYGRFGALVKIGGKTEAVVYQKSVFSDDEAAALGLPEDSYSVTNYKENFHGHFPLGFVGALGYKYDIKNSNFSLFAEAEYYGISLKRNYSEIQEFNTNIYLEDGTLAAEGFYTIDNLPDGVNKRTTYVDELSNTNTDSSKELSQKVPYSSFGINFGITYVFKSRKDKA